MPNDTERLDIESLAALMNEDETTSLLEIDPNRIDPDPNQPRRSFDQGELSELSESLTAQGVIQPLVVSLHPDDPERYMLVAGERRWRGAIMAGLTLVPVVLRTLEPDQRLAVQLVENLDRSALDILEEALAVTRLLGTFGKSAREVARMTGKSQSWVSIRKKLGENIESVSVFVTGGRTTDPETLSMLVDLERLSPGSYGVFMLAERVSRADVRAALDLAKAPPPKVAPEPVAAPPAIAAPTVFTPQDQADPKGEDEPSAIVPTLIDGASPIKECQFAPTTASDQDDADLIPADAFGGGAPTPSRPIANPPRTNAPAPKDTPKPKPESTRHTIVNPSSGQPDNAPLIDGAAGIECRKAEEVIGAAWNLKVRAVLNGKGEEGELIISFRDLSDLKNLVNCLG